MKIRLGTRGSPLAIAQSSQIARMLEVVHPGLEVEMVRITTTGDILQQGGSKPEHLTKAVFTKEIEEALLDGRIDLAVHSCKDLAAVMPEGLMVAAFPQRASSADVLVSRYGLASVRAQDRPQLATGSARRRLQWAEVQPGVVFHSLRGNIDTRLRRLRETAEWDGIILAAAGLARLEPDLTGLQVDILPFDWMLPAPGQGVLALQVRADDAYTRDQVAALEHGPTRRVVEAERSLLKAMQAGCDVPLGALAECQGSIVRLRAAYYETGATKARRAEVCGEDPLDLGRQLAEVFRK